MIDDRHIKIWDDVEKLILGKNNLYCSSLIFFFFFFWTTGQERKVLGKEGRKNIFPREKLSSLIMTCIYKAYQFKNIESCKLIIN